MAQVRTSNAWLMMLAGHKNLRFECWSNMHLQPNCLIRRHCPQMSLNFPVVEWHIGMYDTTELNLAPVDLSESELVEGTCGEACVMVEANARRLLDGQSGILRARTALLARRSM